MLFPDWLQFIDTLFSKLQELKFYPSVDPIIHLILQAQNSIYSLRNFYLIPYGQLLLKFVKIDFEWFCI